MTDAELPENITYEILDDCYIPDPSADTKSEDGIDWAEVEREAFRITGNSELIAEDSCASRTKGESGSPAGRITIIDDKYNGGQPFGVAGVKVICNVFVKFGSAYTDRDGYYSISKKFTSKPRYRLRFKNKEGFSIGLNLVLISASTSALGKGSANGMDVTITQDSERKSMSDRCHRE